MSQKLQNVTHCDTNLSKAAAAAAAAAATTAAAAVLRVGACDARDGRLVHNTC